jgi:hypothetical protein
MKRATVTAVVTLLLGAYLSLPALMFFDCSQQVVVLPRPHIDRLIVLSKKAWARHRDVNGLRNRRTQDSLLELAEIESEMESIEAEGRCGYRVVSQELFLEGYQTPHIARTLFPWVRHAGRIFERDADEYLVWLWFTIVCLNVVLLAYSEIHKRWEGDLKVVAWARWLLFCACAMAASMSLIALINYQIDLRALKVLSLVFSGPAYVYDQYGYSISWIWDERLILYSGIQWLLIGLVGCIVIKWLRGRHLPWCIIATLAACAGLGLGLADVPDRSGPVLLYGAHDARRDGPHPVPLPPGEGEIQRPAARNAPGATGGLSASALVQVEKASGTFQGRRRRTPSGNGIPRANSGRDPSLRSG